MITFNIQRHTPPRPQHHTQVQKAKFIGVAGSAAHRRFLHKRGVDNCPFKKGDLLIFKRKRFLLNDILEEDYFEYVHWKGLEPHFLELMNINDGEVVYTNPGQCRKVRNVHSTSQV